MKEAWQQNIPKMWEERKVELPDGSKPEDLIKVPENAQYFAAIGAVEFGKDEDPDVGIYMGTECLEDYISVGRQAEKAKSGSAGLSASEEELTHFKQQYTIPKFVGAKFTAGETVHGFMGIDGGSTSTKAVLLSQSGDVLCKAYQLSNGNPIQDTIDMFAAIRGQVESQGASLDVLGIGTTGYAKDVLKDVLRADVALVETVAHTESAMKFYKNPHVIVDVGGQDIKLIVLKDGRVKDFKLNTQCSAGNGYFLQGTAEALGYKVEEYADIAFAAQTMPLFGYGCAVFMQSDIVNFQRQGWRGEEILAGLAAVLPKNIFLYVAGIPNLAKLGSRFILQGGTQKNLAAVKSEVDFIRSHFHGVEHEPEVIVHEHCGESGAIGAAVEALRLYKNGHRTSFIGLDAIQNIGYRTTRNEDTRCYFLQEQLPAHVYRCQCRRNRQCFVAASVQVEGSATGRRTPPHYFHLRKGSGRRRQRHARHQGGPRRGENRQPEFRGCRSTRSVAVTQPEECCRSDTGALVEVRHKAAHCVDARLARRIAWACRAC